MRTNRFVHAATAGTVSGKVATTAAINLHKPFLTENEIDRILNDLEQPHMSLATALQPQDIDDYVAVLLAGNPGIGAVVIDRDGHVKLPEGIRPPANTGLDLDFAVHPSIQAAIDAAANGDTVYIAAGKYREQITVRGKSLAIVGATGDDGSLLATMESPDATELEIDLVGDPDAPHGECALIRISDGANVTIRHLIIDGLGQCARLQRDPNPDTRTSGCDFGAISAHDSLMVVENVRRVGFGPTRRRDQDLLVGAGNDAESIEAELEILPTLLPDSRLDSTPREAVTDPGPVTVSFNPTEPASGRTRLLDRHGELLASYCSIQAAINAAASGDRIEIQAGEYRENLFVDKNLTISGAGVPRSSDHSATTLIVGTMTLGWGAQELRIDGLSLTGGIAADPHMIVEDAEGQSCADSAGA